MEQKPVCELKKRSLVEIANQLMTIREGMGITLTRCSVLLQKLSGNAIPNSDIKLLFPDGTVPSMDRVTYDITIRNQEINEVISQIESELGLS